MMQYLALAPKDGGQELRISVRRSRPFYRDRYAVVRVALICMGIVCFFGCRRSDDPPSTDIEKAIQGGNTTQLKNWLTANPDLAVKPTGSGMPPMHVAARAGRVKCAELLLTHGAKPDAIDMRIRTPLFHAAAWGHTDVVTWLLEHGAKIDHRDQDAYQPLHLAVQNGRDKVVALLVARGADVNAHLKEGTTPLHSAVSLEYDIATRILVEAGADPTAKKSDGITPLSIAQAKGRTNIVELLESYIDK